MAAVRTTRPLPAITAEQIDSGGRAAPVHRCPHPSQGPLLVDTADGETALRYMYAHFVFTWREGTSWVDVGHGTVEHSAPLWDALLITGEWHPRTLAHFGAAWARRHLARFRSEPAEKRDT